MRDLANKMAELSFEAPLARFEETDEWGDTMSYQTMNSTQQSSPNANLKAAITDALTLNLKEQDNNVIVLEENALQNGYNDNDLDGNESPNCNSSALMQKNSCSNMLKDNVDNFTEGFTGSLEDLVNTFDEKLTKCFGNYEESVEKLAPVQVRTQEEVMNDCQ